MGQPRADWRAWAQSSHRSIKIMARKPSPNLTEVELQILGVLWDRGPSTVRQVHEALEAQRETGLSTTQDDAGHDRQGPAAQDDEQRPQVYRPALSQEQAQTQFVDDLIQRVFAGAADKLILRAVSSRHVSRKDLEQIRKLLKKLQGDGQ